MNSIFYVFVHASFAAPKGRYVKPGELKAHSHGRELDKPIFTEQNSQTIEFVEMDEI